MPYANECLYPDCRRRAPRKAYCPAHKRQLERGEELCSIPLRERQPVPKVCTFAGCGRPGFGKGLCRPHYKQQARGQELVPVGDTRYRSAAVSAAWARQSPEVRQARIEKLLAGGSLARTEEWRDQKSQDVKEWWAERKKQPFAHRTCDACGKTFDATSWRQVWCTPACRNLAAQAIRFGLPVAEYVARRSSQGGACAICGKVAPLHVDHDHETGRFRGLLCSTCNTGLGKLGDSVESLERAIKYLRRAG